MHKKSVIAGLHPGSTILPLLALAWAQPAPGPTPVTEPVVGGIVPRMPEGLGPRNADCAGCHPVQAQDHSGSRHAVAASNPVFRAAWEHWPNGWCLGCHAPLVEGQVALIGAPAVSGALRGPLAEPAPGAWSDGVGCVVCHVDDGQILSLSPPSETAVRAHPVRQAPEIGTERLCARCHEFPFQLHTPTWPFQYGDEPSQATITEWQGSRAAAEGVGCRGCHMPEGRHSFPGAHTPEFVLQALEIRVKARKDEVVATVSARAPHRIPTGDPFRRLELQVCADRACSERVARTWLRRTHAPDETTWRLLRDTTVPPSTDGRPSRRSLTIPAPSARTLCGWELKMRYGDPRFEPLLPASEVGYTIASGALPCREE